MLEELSEVVKGGARGFGSLASKNKSERKGQREVRKLRAGTLGRKSLFTKSFGGESDGRKTKVCYTGDLKRTPPHRGWICLMNPDVL